MLQFFGIRVRISKKVYCSWEEALKVSNTYADKEITSKTLNSALLVKKKLISYQQDFVCFKKELLSEPKLLCLSLILLKKKNISILDYGGGFANYYYQQQKILDKIKNFKLFIVEQKAIALLGKKYFNSKKIKFYTNILELRKKIKIDILSFSSSLQYLGNYKKILNDCIKFKSKIICLERTSFIKTNSTEEIRIQINPKKIYKSTYPINLLNEKKIILFLKNKGYNLFYEKDEADFIYPAQIKSLLFIRND